jgi:hypothetical protein
MERCDDAQKLIYMQLGVCSLDDYIKELRRQKKSLNARNLRQVCAHILSLVLLLADKGAYYCDLKPANLIILREDPTANAEAQSFAIKAVDMASVCFDYQLSSNQLAVTSDYFDSPLRARNA